MSWIGGLNDSFTQLTSKAGQIGGQLSSFTKEVLTETTDEAIDFEAEVKALRLKLIDAEATINHQQAQIAEKQQNISVLEEQCRRSELDAHSRICQYEAELEKREKLFSKLDSKNVANEEFQFITGSDYFGAGNRRTFSGSSHDAADYADVIGYQQEISHLLEELELSRQEKERLRSTLEKSGRSSLNGEESSQSKVKELELRLHETIDRHQHEHLSLQQANATTVQRLQDQIRVLSSRVSGDDGSALIEPIDEQQSQKQALISLQSEADELKEKLRTKSRQLQAQKKTIENLRLDLSDREKVQQTLNAQLESLKTELDSAEKEKTKCQVDNKVKMEKFEKFCECLREAVGVELDSDCSHDALIDHVKNIRETRDGYHDKVSDLKMRMENLEKEKFELIDSLNGSPAHSVSRNSEEEGKGIMDEVDIPMQEGPKRGPLHKVMPLYQSSPSLERLRHDKSDENFLMVSPNDNELPTPAGDVTLTIQALQKQVDDYEIAMVEYAALREEWKHEKQVLQSMLDRYEQKTDKKEENVPASSQSRAVVLAELQQEIRDLQQARASMESDKQELVLEKEHLHAAVVNLQDELNQSITDTQVEKDRLTSLKTDLENALFEKNKLETLVKGVSEELSNSRMEKTELDEELIALDEQHQGEMSQMLQIRDDLNKELKEKKTKLASALKEIEDMRSQHQTTSEEMAKLKENSHETELRSVLEDMAALVDEKQSADNRLEEAAQEVQVLKKRLLTAEEQLLESDKKSTGLELDLDKLTTEKKSLDEKILEMENENRSFVDSLQEEMQRHVVAAQKSEDRLNMVREQMKVKESELQAALSNEEELQNHQRTINNELNILQKKLETSREESTSTLASKDVEMESLRVELQALKDENKKRVEQLTKQSDTEAAASNELSSIKNELLNVHRQLETSENEKNALTNQIKERKSKIKVLKEELEAKNNELSILSRKFDDAQNFAEKQIQETISKYETKLQELNQHHESLLAELQSHHDTQVQSLEVQLEETISEHEDKVNHIEEEKLNFKHENSTLIGRIKYMEQELAEELEKMQDTMHQSSEMHKEEIKESKSVNDRLSRELNQQHSLVESLEDEMRKLLEVEQDKSVKNEQEFSQLHSAALNEKNQLKTAFDEDKEQLKAGHDRAVKKMKEEFQYQVEELEEDHAKKILNTVTELKQSHLVERDSLKDRIHLLEEEVKEAHMELQRAQIDLKTLSNRYDQEEQNWKKKLSQTVEEIKESHQNEMQDLQTETDNMIQQNLHQLDSNSLNSELVQSQMMQLQDDNMKLHTEIKNLKNAIDKQQESFQHKLNDIENLNQQLSEQNDILEKDLLSATEKSSQMQDQHEMETELLKQEAKLQQGTSASTPNMNEAVEPREEASLPQENISSLLAMIKEKDEVISALRERSNDIMTQLQSQPSPDVENRVQQLIEEKEQMMSVISGKTKENRQLKDELHKMVDVISAGKNALSKVQEENQSLVAKYEGFDQGMNRETVSKLSKLISEKDLEIESLKQKCQTLLDVLQQQEQRQGASVEKSDANVSSQQVQALLQDRETLSQQVRQLLSEREHLVALVNSKHQEAVLFQEKAQGAADSLEQDAAENSRLQILYSNLVHDYEQVELRLSSVQKEATKFKESMNYLEDSKKKILTRIDAELHSSSEEQSTQMLDVMENLRSDSSKSFGGRTKEDLERMAEKNSEALLQKDVLLQETLEKRDSMEKQIDQLRKDLREKDILIHQKTNKLKQNCDDLAQKTSEVGILRRSVENLREQISASTREITSLQERLEVAERISIEKESEAQAFQETNAQLSVMLKEREYELESLREKVQSLNDLLQHNEQGQNYETQKYLKELDRAKEQATMAKHERDQILLTLKQKQMETQRSSDEARHLRDKETKLQSELTRLRSHLVQVEETYTQEAVLSGDREQALRERLEQIQTKNASAVEANQLSKQQLESLQEQIRSATQQRDQAMHNFQLAQEQSSQYAGALQQLQMAAERMQREEAATYAARVDKINLQYKEKMEQANNLVRVVAELKSKLNEANIALESASRLNEQLEVKEQSIDQLKDLVSQKQLEIEEIQDELHRINAKSDNMVDRLLVKNLLIGYFNSPVNKQDDVIRLISSMIGFTKEEEMKLHPSRKGWVTGWLPWGRGDASAEGLKQHEKGGLNESFTGMFVKFLENESKAKQPLAKLPAAAMISDAQQRMNQRKNIAKIITPPTNNPQHTTVSERSTVAGRYNPFLATSTPTSGETTSSHPLMQPLGSMLPAFTPVSNPATSERDILQGILHPSDAS